jgi:glycosyltransferase
MYDPCLSFRVNTEPLLSIVTVCFNSENTLEENLLSVDTAISTVSPNDVEHLIIDGSSSDSTLNIIENHKATYRRVLSEKDTGIYNAMNKGLSLSRGKYVWFLNSDDLFDPNVFNWFFSLIDLLRSKRPKVLIGEITMFRDTSNQRVFTRRWKVPVNISRARSFGWHPPHPAFIAERSLLNQLGGFDEDKKISADHKLMMLSLNKVMNHVHRFPENLVLMREAGASNASMRAVLHANVECYHVQCELGCNGFVAGINIVMKLVRKFTQVLHLALQNNLLSRVSDSGIIQKDADNVLKRV